VRKSSDSGRHLDLNNLPHSRRHVTATHNFNRPKIQQTYLRKLTKINSETYVKTPKRLKEQITHIHQGKKLVLPQHVNIGPHTSVATSVAVESTELEVVPYPLYSPDLALSGFSLLATLKKHLKGIHFTCNEALPAATGKWFQEQPEEFCSSGFK
jgi:transposase